MKLNALDLNKIPEKIQSGELSRLQAVHLLAEFIVNNKNLYGLNRFNEDFTHNLVVKLLENGLSIFEKYDQELGSFFNYFYKYIKNQILTEYRSENRIFIHDSFNTSESISSYSEVMDSYQRMDFGFLEERGIPYAAKKITPEVLREAFKIPCLIKKDDKHHHFILTNLCSEMKALLVISLKAAFYLNDDKIKLISEICNINHEDLFIVIQEIKDNMALRMNRRFELEEKRNKLYYMYCKYDALSNIQGLSEEKHDFYIQKARSLKIKLEEINLKLKKGTINIRPSNKIVSEITGISERQISYYMKLANNTDEISKVIGKELIFNDENSESDENNKA